MTTKGAIAIAVAIVVSTAMVLVYDYQKTQDQLSQDAFQHCVDNKPANYISPIGCG